MPRYRVTVSYDGTDFHGWQKQPGFRTVQEEIEQALVPLSPEGAPVSVHGAGRTDAGVHARGQVAHFDLARDIAPASLRRALNDRLAGDVRILDARVCADDFDAQRSAHAKEYRYRIWNAEVMAPTLRRYRCRVGRALDLAAMRRAAADYVGEHDFAAFSANPQREIGSTVRHVYSVEIHADLPEVEIRVTGNGFLYKMVRSLSGYLISVGTGRAPADAVPAILASRVRTARVESAPPQGLFLWQVWYDEGERLRIDQNLFPAYAPAGRNSP